MICQDTGIQTQVARPAGIWAQAQGIDPSQEKSTITGLKFSFWSDGITFFVPSDRVDWANCLNVHLMFKMPNPIQIL